MVCHILSRTLLLSLLLLLCSQASLTAGELAYAEGTTEASYEEQADAQSKQLSGPSRKLSYRALELKVKLAGKEKGELNYEEMLGTI